MFLESISFTPVRCRIAFATTCQTSTPADIEPCPAANEAGHTSTSKLDISRCRNTCENRKRYKTALTFSVWHVAEVWRHLEPSSFPSRGAKQRIKQARERNAKRSRADRFATPNAVKLWKFSERAAIEMNFLETFDNTAGDEHRSFPFGENLGHG